MVDVSNIDPRLLAIIEAARKQTGAPLSITSGYRDPAYNRKVGGAKRSYHTRGLASDIDLSGLDDAQRASVVKSLREAGGKGFITYDNHPNMLHVDLRPNEHFMHNKSARNMAQAPTWFQKIAGTNLTSRGPGLAALAPNGLRSPAPVAPMQNPLQGILAAVSGGNQQFPAAPPAPIAVADGPKGQEMLPPSPVGLPDMAGSGMMPGLDMKGIEGALGKIAGSFGQGRNPQAEAHATPIQSSLGAAEAADAGRMAAGQQLMAQLLASKKKRVPGMSLMG